VKVREDGSEKAFERYWELTYETTTRQGFFAHSASYHKRMWESLKRTTTSTRDGLTAHLLTATYDGKILVTWIVFVFHDTLYYPYGASSGEHREVMASTAMMWETIRWGKKMGLKKFDMWGSLGENADPKDSWFGFHRFKQGFGPELVEFVGSYDLVIHPMIYQLYRLADKARWFMLRFKK
jgi:lipid II:glycine glycyltransferase (peptidoglycan interpeptide bridge formation enzyme)